LFLVAALNTCFVAANESRRSASKVVVNVGRKDATGTTGVAATEHDFLRGKVRADFFDFNVRDLASNSQTFP
jgi:hypothetical protein